MEKSLGVIEKSQGIRKGKGKRQEKRNEEGKGKEKEKKGKGYVPAKEAMPVQLGIKSGFPKFSVHLNF